MDASLPPNPPPHPRSVCKCLVYKGEAKWGLQYCSSMTTCEKKKILILCMCETAWPLHPHFVTGQRRAPLVVANYSQGTTVGRRTSTYLFIYLFIYVLAFQSQLGTCVSYCSTEGPLSELHVLTKPVLIVTAGQLFWVCLHAWNSEHYQQPVEKCSSLTANIAADFSGGWLSVGGCFWGPRAALAVMTRLWCTGSSALVHSSVLYQELEVHGVFPSASLVHLFDPSVSVLQNSFIMAED